MIIQVWHWTRKGMVYSLHHPTGSVLAVVTNRGDHFTAEAVNGLKLDDAGTYNRLAAAKLAAQTAVMDCQHSAGLMGCGRPVRRWSRHCDQHQTEQSNIRCQNGSEHCTIHGELLPNGKIECQACTRLAESKEAPRKAKSKVSTQTPKSQQLSL